MKWSSLKPNSLSSVLSINFLLLIILYCFVGKSLPLNHMFFDSIVQQFSAFIFVINSFNHLFIEPFVIIILKQ